MDQTIQDYIQKVLQLVHQSQQEYNRDDLQYSQFLQNFSVLHHDIFEEIDPKNPLNKFWQLSYCLSEIFAKSGRLIARFEDFEEEQFFNDFNTHYLEQEDKYFLQKEQNSLLSLNSNKEKPDLSITPNFFINSANLINKLIQSDQLLFSLKIIIKCIQESHTQNRLLFDNEIIELEEQIRNDQKIKQDIENRQKNTPILQKFDKILEYYLKTGRIGELQQTLLNLGFKKQFKFFNSQIPQLREDLNSDVLGDSFYDEDSFHIQRLEKNTQIGCSDWIKNRLIYRKQQNQISEKAFQLLNSQLSNEEEPLVNLQQMLQRFLQCQIYKRYIVFRKQYPLSYLQSQECPHVQNIFDNFEYNQILTQLFDYQCEPLLLQKNFSQYLQKFEETQQDPLLQNLHVFFNLKTNVNIEKQNKLSIQQIFIAFVNSFKQNRDHLFNSNFSKVLFNKFELREMFYYIVGKNQYFDANFISDFIDNNMDRMNSNDEESILMKRYLTNEQQQEVQRAITAKQRLSNNRQVDKFSNEDLENNLQYLSHWVDESCQAEIVFKNFFQCLKQKKYKDCKSIYQKYITRYNIQEINFFKIREMSYIIQEAICEIENLDRQVQEIKEVFDKTDGQQQQMSQQFIQQSQNSIQSIENCIYMLQEDFNQTQIRTNNQNDILLNEQQSAQIGKDLQKYLVDRVMNFFKIACQFLGYSDICFEFINTLCVNDMKINANILMDVSKEAILSDPELLKLFVVKQLNVQIFINFIKIKDKIKLFSFFKSLFQIVFSH